VLARCAAASLRERHDVGFGPALERRIRLLLPQVGNRTCALRSRGIEGRFMKTSGHVTCLPAADAAALRHVGGWAGACSAGGVKTAPGPCWRGGCTRAFSGQVMSCVLRTPRTWSNYSEARDHVLCSPAAGAAALRRVTVPRTGWACSRSASSAISAPGPYERKEFSFAVRR
jgi:hypothetical protein